MSDVESHEKDLDSLESAVNDVITLVDEDHQSELSSRLQSVSLRYRCHGFSSHCYPVERWLDEQSLQLCRMAPTGVVVTEIQVGGEGPEFTPTACHAKTLEPQCYVISF